MKCGAASLDLLLAVARRIPFVRRTGVLSRVCRSRVDADGVTESGHPTGRGRVPTYPFAGSAGALFHMCRSGVGAEPRPVAVEPKWAKERPRTASANSSSLVLRHLHFFMYVRPLICRACGSSVSRASAVARVRGPLL